MTALEDLTDNEIAVTIEHKRDEIRDLEAEQARRQRERDANAGEPKFLRIGEFAIPIKVDETLKNNEWRLEPQLTQDDIDRWIKENPEKAKKMLADAKEAMKRSINQLTSSSYTVKSESEQPR